MDTNNKYQERKMDITDILYTLEMKDKLLRTIIYQYT